MSGTSITGSHNRALVLPEYRPARTAAGRWWLDLPLRTKGLALTAVPLVVTVSLLVVSVLLQERESVIRNETDASTRSLVSASVVAELVIDAEAGMRGYAATRDPSLLAAYDLALESLPPHVSTIATETPDTIPTDAEAVVAATEQSLAALSLVRDQLATAPLGAEQTAEVLAPGTAAVDELQAQLNPLRLELLALVGDQTAELASIQSQIMWTLSVGLVVVILTSALGGWIISSSILGRTVRLSDNIKAYWSEQPLQPSTMAGDEIGHLTRSLGEAAILLNRRHEQLTASRDSALAATQAKDEFLSRMSHELRTPLTAIIGFGQLLQMRDLSHDDRESVDHIVRAGDHLLALINEVLDIAGIESGHVRVTVRAVPVAAVIEQAVAMVGASASDRSVAVSVAPAGGLAVVADDKRVKQVLLNLLTNAVKFSNEGGRVDVSCSASEPTSTRATDAGRIRLSVTDHGDGIAPEDQVRLFEPFERLGAADSGIEGTGMGLALSKGLVEAMGGTIGVESAVGRGSTFWFELPRADIVSDAASDAPGEVDGDAEVPVVLYIEDNATNVRLMERVFRDRPERLEIAMHGRAGIVKARELQPRVVLLDLHLPDVDGREVLGVLKADPTTSAIPVVVISADAMPRNRTQLRIDGAVEYLAKPVDVPELMGLLDRIARRGPFRPRATERPRDLRHA